MSAPGRLALVGGRGSGKSTWVGALWLGARRREAIVQARGLPEELAPLDALARPLLRGQYPPRTHSANAGTILAPLRLGGAEPRDFSLEIADFDGEEVRQIFDKRDIGWTPAWAARARVDLGWMVFVRPKRVARVLSLRLGAAPADPDSTRAMFPDLAPEDASVRGAPAPTELPLIEVLQFLRAARGLRPGVKPPERLSVVLTCWDELAPGLRDRSPDEVFEHAAPLLHDFTYGNFDPARVRVFGVSATGGNLEDRAWKDHVEREDLDLPDVGYTRWQPARGAAIAQRTGVAWPLVWAAAGADPLR